LFRQSVGQLFRQSVWRLFRQSVGRLFRPSVGRLFRQSVGRLHRQSGGRSGNPTGNGLVRSDSQLGGYLGSQSDGCSDSQSDGCSDGLGSFRQSDCEALGFCVQTVSWAVVQAVSRAVGWARVNLSVIGSFRQSGGCLGSQEIWYACV